MSFVALIRDNAVQTVELTRATRDMNGDPVGNSYEGNQYEDPVEIEVVYQPASGMISTSSGQQVQVESSVIALTEILLDDLIDNSVVKRVVPVIDFDGLTIGYEAFL